MKKIIITVVKLNGLLYFLFMYRGKKIYFFKINSGWFDCMPNPVEISFLRDNKEIDKGGISIFGTHSSSEYFTGLREAIPEDKHLNWSEMTFTPTVESIESIYLKEGDVLEFRQSKTKTQFFNLLILMISTKKDVIEFNEQEEIRKEKESEISLKHKNNKKVFEMLLTRLWNKHDKMSLKITEKRKKQSVIVENG